MTKLLSPAAQAVIWAAAASCWDPEGDHEVASPAAIAAAALRAAADQLDHSTSEHTLYAIADELDAH